ncbi:MAG: hypothetical protein KKG59_06320, partial [Nanoarchaeota archaeon]|nr:hypothetical protein [Nanoarchaeota archaeon]
MNSQYLEKMLSSMDSFERYESSSHMPAGILVPIEQELLLGQTYVAKKPHITTGSALERTGIIR